MNWKIIYEAHAGITGWCSVEKMESLVAIVLASRPLISLEIGVWAGKSTIPVALAHKYLNRGHVIAVDPWMAEASVEGQVNPADRGWWANQKMHDSIYQMFMADRVKLGLQSFIQVERKTSRDFVPPNGIGLLMIDGNHGVQVLEDVQRYAPMVSPGGYIVMDDLKWSGGAVSDAVSNLLAMGFRELYQVDNANECWAVFQKA